MRGFATTMLLLTLTSAGPGVAQTSGAADEPDVRTRSRMSEQGPYRSRMRVLRDSAELAAPSDPESLLKSLAGNDYAQALLLRRLAFNDVSAENVDGAIERLEKALLLDALAAPAQAQMALNLARLYASAGRHAEAVAMLGPWLSEHPDADAEIVFTLGLSLVETGEHAQGQRLLRRAIAGRSPPPESWLQVLLYSQHKSADYRAAANTLRQLLTIAPDNGAYWLQLGGMLRAAGDAARAAAVLEQAALAGLLVTPEQRLQLVNAYLAAELPFDAAELLEALLTSGDLPATAEHWTLAGHAWLAARESARAFAPLTRAAEVAGNVAAWLELARLQVAENRWQDAIASLERARRGNELGARNGEALLLLGEARYRTGDTRAARKAFGAAAAEGVVYRAAQAWLDFLDSLPADGR